MLYSQLIDRFRVMLKSDSPRVMAGSHHGMAAVGLEEKLSPAKLPYEVSKDFCHVNETSYWKP